MKHFLHLILTLLSYNAFGENIKRTLPTPAYPKSTKYISQTSLSSSATNMYTIQQGGIYYLANDIDAAPSSTNRRVIKITANNVVLNLNGMTISQSHSNSQSGLNAIDIASSVSNVTIMNGFINNVSDVGINVGTNCNNIRISNVSINNCDSCGLLFNTVNNVTLKNVDATNCNGTGTSAPGNDAFGLYMSSCSNFSIEDCHFDYNRASGTRPAYGIELTSCNDGIIKNTSGSANNGIGSVCYGFYITACNAISLENCTATANSTTTSGNCDGFHIDGTSNAIKLKNCLSQGNASAASSSGFYLGQCKYCVVEECESSYNSGSSGETNGFHLALGQGNTIIKCKAIANTHDSGDCYGIKLNTSETSSIITECESSSNTTTTSGVTYGIYIASSSTNNIVTKNVILNNVGIGLDFGYYDATNSTTGTTTLIGGNIAFGQGACSPTSATNLSNSGTGGNYYFQLITGDLNATTNSPDKMIQEIKIGKLAESGTTRITTSGEINVFGTFDNLSLIQ